MPGRRRSPTGFLTMQGRLLTVNRIILGCGREAATPRLLPGRPGRPENRGPLPASVSERNVRFLSVPHDQRRRPERLTAREVAALLTRSGTYRVGAAISSHLGCGLPASRTSGRSTSGRSRPPTGWPSSSCDASRNFPAEGPRLGAFSPWEAAVDPGAPVTIIPPERRWTPGLRRARCQPGASSPRRRSCVIPAHRIRPACPLGMDMV